MRPRGGPQFDIWVVDERDDPATFPPWLADAVMDRFEAGLFVLTDDAGVIEARPGDLIVRDGERVSVHIGQEVEPRSVRPSPSRAEIAPTNRRPAEGTQGALAVLAVTLFLGLLAFALAWLMIKLIGHDRPRL
jgi:hypothetical protein